MKGYFTITPLGAAIVEAMPDKASEREVQRAFRREAKCPTSRLFPTKESVETFYLEHGSQVTAIEKVEAK